MKGRQAARPQERHRADATTPCSYSNSRRNYLNTGQAAKATGASCKLVIPRAEKREPQGPTMSGSSASQGASKMLTCPVRQPRRFPQPAQNGFLTLKGLLGELGGSPQAKVRAGRREIADSAESTKPCGHSSANAGEVGGCYWGLIYSHNSPAK